MRVIVRECVDNMKKEMQAELAAENKLKDETANKPVRFETDKGTMEGIVIGGRLKDLMGRFWPEPMLKIRVEGTSVEFWKFKSELKFLTS
jgi:hypothetical protein